jgi:hypothetical protein
LTPARLEIARQEDGRPDFHLSLVRGPNPALPPEPHGILDFRLRAHYAVDGALAAARARYPNATVAPCSFTGGWFRLYPVAGVREEVPADLLRPTPLAWNGLGVARCALKTSEVGGDLLEKALLGEQLLFHAKVEMEIEGVSPRLPAQVSFNPAEMWRALRKISGETGGLSREGVVALFRGNYCPVALRTSGDLKNVDRDEFAQVMADRVRMRFGAFAPSPVIDDGDYYVLSGDAPGEGTFLWDLNEPMRALRPLVMFLRPLDEARRLARESGIDAVRGRSTVSQLQTGAHVIEIAANIPGQPTGVAALGVTVTAPAKKPFRPQPQIKTVELRAPAFTDKVSLLLSPKEALDYQYKAYAVQELNGQPRKWDGESRPWQGDRLLLSPDDFPVRMIAIELSSSLRRLASSVTGTLSWKTPGEPEAARTAFVFESLDLTLAIPRSASEAALSFEVTSLDGARKLRLGPVPATSFNLGFHSLPEYGPHTVEIECLPPQGAPLYAIDLLGEGEPESKITVLSFTPKQPRKEWSWFAESPFHPGFRYRKHAQPGDPPAPWSEVLGPFEALRIDAA